MAWLEKPHWLAPPPKAAFQPANEEMAIVKPLIERYGPQQVMLYDPEAETGTATATKMQPLERLILVPNDWPRQVPLPPRPRD